MLNTRLHNRENRLPAVHASMENDISGEVLASEPGFGEGPAYGRLPVESLPLS